jgi:hypothetical protein
MRRRRRTDATLMTRSVSAQSVRAVRQAQKLSQVLGGFLQISKKHGPDLETRKSRQHQLTRKGGAMRRNETTKDRRDFDDAECVGAECSSRAAGSKTFASPRDSRRSFVVVIVFVRRFVRFGHRFVARTCCIDADHLVLLGLGFCLLSLCTGRDRRRLGSRHGRSRSVRVICVIRDRGKAMKAEAGQTAADTWSFMTDCQRPHTHFRYSPFAQDATVGGWVPATDGLGRSASSASSGGSRGVRQRSDAPAIRVGGPSASSTRRR